MTQREYLKLSVGFILTLITTPLMGLVDTAMMGHMNDPAYIGGVAVGALIFSTLYWLFGFLRVSTIAFTAQARGKKDVEGLLWTLARPFILSVLVSLVFILFQKPILSGALLMINPGVEVSLHASQYFEVLIWGAPFVLVNYVCSGWLMGMTQLRATLALQIFTNLFNLALTFLFVIQFQWGIYGVASGTLIAQMVSCILSAWLVIYYGKFDFSLLTFSNLLDREAYRKIMSVNGDLLVRTICLLIMTNLFTAVGATFGTEVLAANAILFQVQYFIGNFIDGFANASSVVSGQAVGKKDSALYERSIFLSWRWASIMIVVLTVIYWVGHPYILQLFTQLQGVLDLAYRYSFWMALYPLSYGFNTVFYGIFNGATLSSPIRNSTLFSLMGFLIGLWILVPAIGNDGLWISFLVFNAVRSLYLMYWIPKSKKLLFDFT